MTSVAAKESTKYLEKYRDLYETLQAEDKVMDRDFRRKFHDIPGHQAEALYKLFRRRPRFVAGRGRGTGRICGAIQFTEQDNIFYLIQKCFFVQFCVCCKMPMRV